MNIININFIVKGKKALISDFSAFFIIYIKGYCNYIIIRYIYKDKEDIFIKFRCVVLPNLKIEGNFH